MRKIIGLAVLLAAIMLLLPLTVLSPEQNTISVSAAVGDVTEAKAKNQDFFTVYNTETEKTEEIPRKEYLFGVVAAEMPALYHEEALKAQAIAAYTYACSRKAQNSGKSYDITTDPTLDQNYITKEAAIEKWGDNADEYIKKIEDIINDTDGYMITYNGSAITAVYHAISSGKTEDCKNIWGSSLPYLKSVVSEGDKLAKGYISKAEFSAEDIKEKFSDIADFSSAPEDWFQKSERTDSGTVSKISLCGEAITGSEIRNALDLRSSNFEIEYTDEKFIFTVYGYGHGVGMSQNGADYMAKQGCDFKEILTHYYTDCKVEKVK